MRTKESYQKFIDVLKEELVPAMGCTEPIAIAYCAAKAGGAVNGCAYAPFILTVDWLGWVCYLPDKLEFILSYHVLPS